MKRLLLGFLLIVCWSGPALAEAPVIGVVVQAYGQASMDFRGETVEAQPLLRIYDGARVNVGSGSLLEVFCVADGRRYELIGPCKIQVEGLRARVLEGSESSVRWVEAAGPGDLVDPSHLPQRGRQDSQLQLQFTDSGDGPLFSWITELPPPYWIRVFTAKDGQVDKVLWVVRTDQTRIRYDGRPLEKDRSYIWQVAAGSTISSARFRVFSTGALDSFQRAETKLQEWTKARPDDPGVHVVQALLYDQNDQPAKALEALRQAAEKQSPEVRQSAVQLRQEALLLETSDRARANSSPIHPYFLAPGAYGGWGWAPGWFYY